MPQTINKARLAELLSEKTGISKKEAENALHAFVDIVIETLKNDGEVTIAGFGAFSARTRKGRAGVNPQNPAEKIEIPSVTVPKFKAGKGLKDALKKPASAGTAHPAMQQNTPAAVSKPEQHAPEASSAQLSQHPPVM